MGCDNSKPVDSTRNKHMEKRREEKALNNEIGQANALAGWSNN